MLEAEMDEHLGYEKNSVAGNNSGNSRNGYGKKTIISDYGECEIAVPRDRNGDFEPKVIEKRQTRTNEIEQKIMQMYAKGKCQRDTLTISNSTGSNERTHRSEFDMVSVSQRDIEDTLTCLRLSANRFSPSSYLTISQSQEQPCSISSARYSR